MPKLIQENRTAWDKLGDLKSMKNPNPEDIERQKECIKKTEKQIQEASFNTDLFFREIGYLYETIIILNKDSGTLGLPAEEDIIHVCASLFIEGNSLELIDGEGFYMPERWIRRVFKKVSDIIGTQNVFTLSVLGLQSSGKSTLLNTMFGSQFPTSSGICTKGIQMHLLPLQRNHRFQFILILDTEGLRSPELSDGKYDIDNQLATVITGIGDTTVLNIMRENSSFVSDILQVVVHAFLCLKLADSNIDIRKSCSFIHHNVTSVTAQDKMRPAIFHLMSTLVSVTKEAAEMEGISDISEFNQIIQINMSSQVWFLPNLWQGFTPMSRINSEYSGQVADIKCKLIEQATYDTRKAYGSLNGVISQTRDLWKGILSEDFVFCFRNSLEIRAYNLLENKVLHWSSEMQCFLQEKCVETSQKEFAKCGNQKKLNDAAIKVNTILLDLLLSKKIDIAQQMEAFFNKNDFGETVRQWKNITKHEFDKTCNEILSSCEKETERFRAKKSFEIFQTTNSFEHEDKLHKKSMKLAKSLHDPSIRPDEIDRQIEMIWHEFIKEIRGKDQVPMVYFFRQRLYELFRNEQSLLELIKQKIL
ncbi:interferon-induced very large GTPase 1-like [Mercenaria mercenaria]|uniref:interferon-induced very large GTPase 1-like n=1 Tax=Mercenaria mercenaria TaxID=6596 RepID=UPI00234F301E|nr:interferon-induced very large GTPase 1-like [Mercenaria mercenaria]XP_053399049.1 interferon-induced very large GTPase 1-like [Mercenaria mercenaria]